MTSFTHPESIGPIRAFKPKESPWLSRTINLPVATGIYVLFMLLVYWPVLIGKRFFYEDFFSQGYTTRDYFYYLFGLHHVIPFWNPYTWSFPAVLSDALSGFWYPGNVAGIMLVRIFAPASQHLPLLVPEIITILHLPLAALGVFYLLKKHYHVADAIALVAGLTYGFGLRMVADQNHPMFIFQLALLPWETLLLFRSWTSIRNAIYFGLLFGVSFLAGQPQVFLFVAVFFFWLTVSESIIRWHASHSLPQLLSPFVLFGLGIGIAIGVASIQLLPSAELAHLSGRSHLSYFESSANGLHPMGLLEFAAPAVFRESGDYNPVDQPMQPSFYWSLLAEILSVFAAVLLWKERGRSDPRSRHLIFAVSFSIFAFAFALGRFMPMQWVFWKFIPFFDQVRAPARMMWFFWFLGTIYGGIGLELFLANADNRLRYRRLLLGCAIIGLSLNLLTASGVLKLLHYHGHVLIAGSMPSLLAGVVMSLADLAFLGLTLQHRLPNRLLFPLAALIIACDLYYLDVTEHHNTINGVALANQEAANPLLAEFLQQHSADHSKLVWHRADSSSLMLCNLGMILRMPIEDADDPLRLYELNPMLLSPLLPPVKDTERRMSMMGVSSKIDVYNQFSTYKHYLPFLKLYHKWQIASGNNESRILNDTSFDYTQTVLLSEAPSLSSDLRMLPDTAVLNEYSENRLKITVTASQSSVLLVNDLYYPAWHAIVDGKETKILRGFTSLRAIPINAGIHTIELRYDDAAFNLGWKITLGTLALSLLALVMGKKQKNPGA